MPLKNKKGGIYDQDNRNRNGIGFGDNGHLQRCSALGPAFLRSQRRQCRLQEHDGAAVGPASLRSQRRQCRLQADEEEEKDNNKRVRLMRERRSEEHTSELK